MKSFLNKNYAIADHTIVLYSGTNVSIKIPEKINSISIRTIGAGAFMSLPELQHIVLPPKVTSVGYNAFSMNPKLVSAVFPGAVTNIGINAFHGCQQLAELTFYDFPVDVKTYTDLKNNALRTSEGIYVARRMPAFDIVPQIVGAVRGVAKACRVPDQVNRLFYTAQIGSDSAHQLMYRNVNNLCFLDKYSKPLTEDQAIVELLQHPVPDPQIQAAEEANDKILRTNQKMVHKKTMIFTFDDRKTKDVNGKKYLSVTFRFGYFFFQTLNKVIHEGKQYYVYSRYYLNSDERMEFTRTEVAVYNDEGIVIDKTEAQNVYAKYKFLCIL